MLSHTKPTSGNASLLGAWHAQVAATARQSPWLVRELLRRKQELLPKFRAYYQQLRALPRWTRRLLQRKLAPSLAGAALLLALGQGHAIAATINVTTNVPDINTDGQCSLIEAIVNANDDAATHADCTAGSGVDTISLPASNTHTLTMVNNTDPYGYQPTGLPVISTEITIEGNGSTIARDNGSPNFGIFSIVDSGNLTLQDTTVSGGSLPSDSGGGVFNHCGALTLSSSTLTGNSAGSGGGVSNVDGVLTVTNSTISGNAAGYGGGGVENYFGTLTMTNSTISGNSASDSGGVYNGDGSTFTLTNSTISGNTSSSHAGGVETTAGSTFTMTNSTITGNRASSDGGGVFHHGDILTLTRTLVSGNTASTGSEISASGTVTANDFNLFGHDNDAGVVGFSPGVTDLVPSVAINAILDPLLSDNGGPTLTHALVPGSPAIDASPADADCEPTDQRGVFRPQGVACSRTKERWTR